MSRPSTAQCWYKFNRNEAYTVLQHALRDKQLQCFASVFQSSEEPCRPTGQMHLVQTLCICIAVRSHWAVRMTMGWAPNKRWTAPHRPPKAIVPLTRKAMRQSSASVCPMPYAFACKAYLPRITLQCLICARQLYEQGVAFLLCGCTLNTSHCVCCPYVPQARLHVNGNNNIIKCSNKSKQ